MKLKSLLLATSLLSTSVFAQQDLTITVQNLTQGMHYTPFVVAAHDSDISLFKVGEAASPALEMMAEGGDIAGLVDALTDADADVVDMFSGPMAPGGWATKDLMTSEGNKYLSLAAMLLPTNDAFTALNSWKIPEEAGTYTILIDAYDAGTEANTEILSSDPDVGFPNAPFVGLTATGGTGVTTEEANNTVHIHRGNLGDDNPTGGKSDIDNTVHRWLNPVAKVTVVVK